MATQTIEHLEVGLDVKIDSLLRVVRLKRFEFMRAIVIAEVPKTATFEITDGMAYRRAHIVGVSVKPRRISLVQRD